MRTWHHPYRGDCRRRNRRLHCLKRQNGSIESVIRLLRHESRYQQRFRIRARQKRIAVRHRSYVVSLLRFVRRIFRGNRHVFRSRGNFDSVQNRIFRFQLYLVLLSPVADTDSAFYRKMQRLLQPSNKGKNKITNTLCKSPKYAKKVPLFSGFFFHSSHPRPCHSAPLPSFCSAYYSEGHSVSFCSACYSEGHSVSF